MGIRRIISCLMMFTIMFVSSDLYAQKKISLIHEGQKAKYTGYLLSEELYVEYETFRKQVSVKEEECKVALSLMEERLKLEYQSEINIRDIKIKSIQEQYEDRIAVKNDNIEYLESKLAANPPDFIDKWKFELGVLTGTILTVILVAVIDEVRYE